MPDDPGKSSTISHRRELLEEVLFERSKAVATLPIVEEDPPARSWHWPAGITRLAMACRGGLLERRTIARSIAVVALAWLEAIDAALTDRAARREE